MAGVKKANLKFVAQFFSNKEKKIVDTTYNRDSHTKNSTILMDAYTAWSALDRFRENARRNKKYTFEDQWGDYVKVGCKTITERQNILNQGNIPLQNNRLRGILRSLVGVFQSTQTEPVCVALDREDQGEGEMMSATLQYVYELNRLWYLDGINLQYLAFSGVSIFKSIHGIRNGKQDVWNDIVNYNDFFVDPHMKDPRHTDCHLVGQIHDKSIYQIIGQFAKGKTNAERAARAEWIRGVYGRCRDEESTISYVADTLMQDVNESKNFFVPTDPVQCRVIEIWKKEYKERLWVHDTLTATPYIVELEEEDNIITQNKIRYQEQAAQGVAPGNMRLLEYIRFVDEPWCYYYLSPQGDVLSQGETPYWHTSHPFSFRIYPFIDGQAFPFIGDFIDQQRYINRLITLDDFVRRASAKGVLLIPQDSIPDGYTIDDIADEWSAFDGVIAYKPNNRGDIPKQVFANASQTGIYDMLQMQLKLLEDISGVQGALQGQAPASGTPASLYMQQTQNSATSLTEIYETYRDLREERDMKNLKLIQQFYPEKKYIGGNSNSKKPIIYDSSMVRDAEMKLSITESTSTPAYRLVMNDFLMQLWQAQAIDVEQLLENGAFPFADKLLQSIKTKRQEIEEAQQAMMQGQQVQQPMLQGAIPEDIQQQVQSQSNNPLVAQVLNSQSA